MRRLTSFEELASFFGTVPPTDRTLLIHDVDIDSPVIISGIHCDRVAIYNFSGGGRLDFRHCHVNELLLSDCATDGLLLSDCRIGILEIRGNSPTRPLTIAGSAFQSIAIHDVGEVVIERSHISSSLVLTGLRNKVHLRKINAASITMAEQLTMRSVVSLIAEEVVSTDNFEIRDISGLDFLLVDCIVRRTLHLCRLHATGKFELSGCRLQGRMLAERIVSTEPVRLIRCDLQEGMIVEQISCLPSESADNILMRLDRTTVGGSFAVMADTAPGDVILEDTLVSGQLQFPTSSARFIVAGATSIHDLEIPGDPVRSLEQIRGLVTRLFGEVSVASLGTLRSALGSRRRLAEEDQCYFLQREVEADREVGVYRLVKKYFLGGVLGWGVRLRAPFRALLMGISLTGLFLYGTGAVATQNENRWGVAAAERSLAVAGALWLNVGTGVPQLLTSTAWTFTATLLTALGLLLITVLIGIAIRRLVR